jgi:hypothetical protein
MAAPAFPRTNRGKAAAAVCQPDPADSPLSHPRATVGWDVPIFSRALVQFLAGPEAG